MSLATPATGSPGALDAQTTRPHGPLGLAALTVLDCDPFAQLELAQRHGFEAIGIRLLPAAPGTTAYPLHEDGALLERFRRHVEDSPVEVFDLEIVRIGEDFDPLGYEAFLDAAAALGGRAVLIGGDDPDRARLTDSYARFADRCAAHGLVASLEFMPWTAVPTARDAVEIVAQADGPGRSILVDCLHVARSATSLEDIAAIPREWLHYGQLCDGSVPAPTQTEQLIWDARNERLAPGEGGIDLAGIWTRLPRGLPASIELPNEPQRRALGTDAWLEHLVAATRRLLGASGGAA